MNGCLNCKKYITWSFAICSDCEKLFGRSALGWPEWLRWMWNDRQRERRRTKKLKQHEVCFTDLKIYPTVLQRGDASIWHRAKVEDYAGAGWKGKEYRWHEAPARGDDTPLLESLDIQYFFQGIKCERMREILKLKAEGYTQAEIANSIGKSRTLVGNELTKTKQQLVNEGLF